LYAETTWRGAARERRYSEEIEMRAGTVRSCRGRQPGFTPIELLVVIAIIAILVAL
jgi:prepilin-type N-terminal cleavage/methylation domain-containing protein